MALTETLTDDFNDNSTDTGLWTSYADAAVSIDETGHRVVCTLADATAGNNYCGYAANDAFDLTLSYAALQLTQPPNPATAAGVYFLLAVDSDNHLRWFVENGTIYAQKKVATVSTNIETAAYDKLTYRWLRVRESDGTVYFDYSQDGVVWNNFTSLEAPFAVTALYPEFGAGTYQSETSPGTAEINYFNVLPDPSSIPKSHLYKCSRSGSYIGLLEAVTTPFTFADELNVAGTQIDIGIARRPDVSNQAPDPILDEDGDPLLDEDGNQILSEHAKPLVGNSRDDILHRNGNDIRVYEYSRHYPNGTPMFMGSIKNWRANWGGSGDIALKAYSDGYGMGQELLVGSQYVSDVSQTSQNQSIKIEHDKGSVYRRGQTFKVGGAVTNIAAIDVMLNIPSGQEVDVRVALHSSASDSTILATKTRALVGNGSLTVYKFTFDTPQEVSSGGTYFFSARLPNYAPFQIFIAYSDANPYADGKIYRRINSGGWDPWDSSLDLYFVTYSNGGETTAAFASADPTDDILKGGMDNYINGGGRISYDDADIEATGLALDYTFIGATVWAMVQKVLDLSPAGFYSYVNPGTNKLKAKSANDSADHVLVKGLHVQELDLVASIENIINDIPASGGVVSGSNIYKRYVSEDSISQYGRGLEVYSDNRVTDTDTLDQIGATKLDNQDDEQYQTEVTVPDAVADITQYRPGDTIGFAGFGPEVAGLVLLIQRRQYAPRGVVLAIGTLPRRTTVTLEQINRDLEAQQTVDNPDAPS